MLAILGTLVGGISAILPALVEMFNLKTKLHHEQKLLELRLESQRHVADRQHDIAMVQADIHEGESLRRHDSTLTGRGFIGLLRTSVRPVITYLFFFLFVFVKLITIYTFINSGGSQDWLGDALAWNSIYPLIWAAQDQAIFGAIMGFWFGSRAMEKLIERPQY